MAGPAKQFSLRRVLALMVAWSIGLAVTMQLPGGPSTIVALLYGAFASLVFLFSERRILIVWFLLMIFTSMVAAAVMQWRPPAQNEMTESFLIRPLLIGIALGPTLALLAEMIDWIRKRRRTRPPTG